MIRFALFIVLAALSVGCEKPDEASCRKAIDNMRRLMGTENLTDNNRLEGEVRRCKGGSSKKAVKCAMNAATYDELRACGFSKLPEKPPFPAAGTDGSGAGSATGSAGTGSAATGSAATGSAATGSGAGSSGSDASNGSAAGSAAAGSGATGSAAAGSGASGSAAGSATGSAATGSAATGSAGSGAGAK
jgi:hypothetical protein